MKQAHALTDRQLKVVLAHCLTRGHAARDRAIVMTSFLAGLRAKEIAALKLADVQVADGSIRAEFVLAATQTKAVKLAVYSLARSGAESWRPTRRGNAAGCLRPDTIIVLGAPFRARPHWCYPARVSSLPISAGAQMLKLG